MRSTRRRANRIAAVLCMVMIFATTGLIATSHSMAVNNTDTIFGYYFTSSVQYITGREKTDASSVYMFYQNGTPAYKAKVCWGWAQNAATNEDATSGTPYYQFTSAHQKRFMYNMVYENHHAYAAAQHLTLYAGVKGISTANNGVCQGVWSPDSVAQSGVLPGSDHL